MSKKPSKTEQVLPITTAIIGGLLAYADIKYAIGEKWIGRVEPLVQAGLFLFLSVWLIREAIKVRKHGGWLTSAGILFYCMFRHLSPLIAQAYSYTFGNSSLLYADLPTYAGLTIFFTITGGICLSRSKDADQVEQKDA